MWEKILPILLVCILSGSSVTEALPCQENSKIFKLLAVEGQSDANHTFSDGKYLIRNLLKFPNWNNSTEFIGEIRLLTNLSSISEDFEDCRRFWCGPATKENLEKAVKDFFDGGENEILYIASHNAKDCLWLGDNNSVPAFKLRQWLGNSADLIIIDACSSEWWIDELVANRTVIASSKKYQDSYNGWQLSRPGIWGVFTGQDNALYPNTNGSEAPLGLIGSFYADTDHNGDGWISATEAYEYANTSTVQYTNSTQTPVFHNGPHDLKIILRAATKTVDINSDGIVNILDIAIVARAFGSTPGDLRWNPVADINSDNSINILDIELASEEFLRG
jgi:hypothetical protein